ncbi:MAG TPA: methyltransferase domain-containing protein [Candidatus Magasanikbacteria bacterium]|nr:methyltransferase domain-containing protein [Candidatus Magasanikbacteria bacterium]
MSKNELSLLDPEIIYKKIDLKEGMKVAEFGCGRTGNFTFTASRKVGDKGLVYAMDILKDVLESIKNRSKFEGYHNILTVWTDLEKVGGAGVPEGSIDAGFFVNVFFQLKNKANAFAEAARLLKKDAMLTVIDWANKVEGKLGPEDKQMVNPEELMVLGKQNGFVLQEKFPAGEYHFCLIFKKEERV